MNPRNGKTVNLEQAKIAEADRLQTRLDQRISDLQTLLWISLPTKRLTMASALKHFWQSTRRPVTEVAIDDPSAIATQCLSTMPFPSDFPNRSSCAWLPASSMLVVDYTLPDPTVVPSETSFRYNRSKGMVVSKARPQKEIRDLYRLVVAQIMLRILDTLCRNLPSDVQTITLNGHVETVDPATGVDIRPALASVRAPRETVEAIDFSRIDPVVCLRSLGAVVSSSPAELTPVRPILDLSMVDKRFVANEDVLSGLSHSQDLMELSPNEFEHLITNLFSKMGLETRQTQASCDGGVDCVAFNHDPVLGGKVVIQAKRYRNTVGVSAVRDLYGTVQNEGASKGILVTTSGYGPAAYDFAKNKPLELFEGSHLLYLLKEHTGMVATVRL